MIHRSAELRMEGRQVCHLYGQGDYGVVPLKALDIAAICVPQIRLPHHTIDRRHPWRLPPNSVSAEEQGGDHCGSQTSWHVPSWKRTFWSAHQGDTYIPYSRSHWMGGVRQEQQMRALHVAASSALSG